MSELNITPHIDVLLVLLVMLILSIPIATHNLDVDLPDPDPSSNHETVSLVVQHSRAVLWNGEAVSGAQLGSRLESAAAQPEMPLIRIEPGADASYEDWVHVSTRW